MELAFREGKPLPKAIQNAPELWPGLALFYGAFLDLDADRPVGLGPGRIPWTAIDRWAQRYGVRGRQFDDLVYYVRAMDIAYLDHYEKKAEARRKKR